MLRNLLDWDVRSPGHNQRPSHPLFHEPIYVNAPIDAVEESIRRLHLRYEVLHPTSLMKWR